MEFFNTFFTVSAALFLLIISIITCTVFIPYFFKKWLGLRSQQQIKALLPLAEIKEPSDIHTVLNMVIKQRSRFIIRLNNRGRSFSSILLKIDPQVLLIDSLFPYEGNELIDHSSFISVKFIIKEAKDVPYKFNSTYTASESFKGYPALKISFPEIVKRDQKRLFHRVEPAVNEPVYAKFSMDGNKMTEKIANISGGGVGFYTNLGKSVLWRGREIDRVSITLPDSPVINCLVIIQIVSQTGHPVLIGGKPYYNYCGAEFGNLDENTRNKIVRYVIERERTELKRISREYE